MVATEPTPSAAPVDEHPSPDLLSCEGLDASSPFLDWAAPADAEFSTWLCDLVASPQPGARRSSASALRAELQRELALLHPCRRGSAAGAAACDAGTRAVVVSWMVEVCTALRLQQTTLFLAAHLFDGATAALQDVPRSLLQLVATACMALAAKQHEVGQPRPLDVWASYCAGAYETQDILRMEWVVLDCVGWRVCRPTAFTFLQLLCNCASGVTPRSKCYASYLLELSLMDQSMQSTSACSVAMAALLSAQVAMEAEASNPVTAMIADLDLDVQEVRGCAIRVTALGMDAQLGAAVFSPVQAKYNSVWMLM